MKERTNGKKHKKMRRYRKVGYSFLSVYAVAAVILVTFCIRLGMVPAGYLAALWGILAVLGGLFALMQRRKAWSVVSDVLCVLLTAGCITACFYIGKADETVRDVARVTAETVTDGLRQIASYTHETGTETIAEPSEDNDSFVMYLSGIDTYGEVSARSRSDVNILAVVNTKTKSVLLLSTPRDYYVDYSVTGGAKDKLTHAGIYGVDASIDALERLYEVDVNYYLRVNFTGFTQIIDALGGVDVYSQYDFTAGGREFYQGYNTVNGTEALSFARERYSFDEGDIQRGRNQMEVIRAVIQKAASSSLLTNYASVMDAVSGSFETNMPQEKIAELVRMQLSDMSSWNITTYTATGQVSSGETYSAPGEILSIVIPDENSVQEAKNMINSILNGGE